LFFFIQFREEALNFNYLLCIPVIPCFQTAATGSSEKPGFRMLLLFVSILDNNV
jgi:hypothetical protein